MVEINNQTNFRISEKKVLKIIEQIKKELKLNKRLDISVGFVTPQVIKNLNKKYRGLSQVTDVLSFTFENKKDLLVGELIICLAQAKRQALIRRQTLEKELKVLLIHGFLHLLDYDHESRKDFQKMVKLENKLAVIN